MFPSFLHFPIGLYSAALSLTFRGFSDMSRSRKRSSGPSRNTLRWRTWAEQRDSPPRWTRPSSCFKSFPKISGHSQLHNSNLRCYRRERTAGQVWSHLKGGRGAWKTQCHGSGNRRQQSHRSISARFRGVPYMSLPVPQLWSRSNDTSPHTPAKGDLAGHVAQTIAGWNKFNLKW